MFSTPAVYFKAFGLKHFLLIFNSTRIFWIEFTIGFQCPPKRNSIMIPFTACTGCKIYEYSGSHWTSEIGIILFCQKFPYVYCCYYLSQRNFGYNLIVNIGSAISISVPPYVLMALEFSITTIFGISLESFNFSLKVLLAIVSPKTSSYRSKQFFGNTSI